VNRKINKEGALLSAGGNINLYIGLAWILIIASSIVGGVQIVLQGGWPKLGAIFGVAAGLLQIWLIKTERYRVASWSFLLVMILLAPISAYTTTGPVSSAWVVLPIATMSGAWFLGARQNQFLAGLGVAGVALVYWLHLSGHQFIQPEPATYAISYSFACIFGAVVGNATATRFESKLDQVTALSNELMRSNDFLELRVNERTTELTAALSELKQTQHILIENEKLASLGAMVAGISHEMNTPIGNAITVSSSMHDQLETLATRIADGKLKRSDLDKYVASSLEMLALIQRSAERAGSLIGHFKQVAMDQTSERRRTFQLQEVVEHNLAALKPGFKHAPWKFDNQVPAEIICDTYPGPLGQVIANLIQNAVFHAFDGRTEGTVTISAGSDEGNIWLAVSDDGNGMSAATLAKAFDPFFTTKLGQGGSGLGLSICRRIATNVLGGHLELTSTQGIGTRCSLEFPSVAPGQHLVL
jgi:signal transduction histidine kinase